MPYIKQSDRIEALICPETPGQLNYAITQLLVTYLKASPDYGYTALNDCIGALEAAKLEFYRRVVIPFENAKKDANGDVY